MNVTGMTQSTKTVGAMNNLTISLKSTVNYSDGDIVEIMLPDVFCMTNISSSRLVSTVQNKVNLSLSAGSTH